MQCQVWSCLPTIHSKYLPTFNPHKWLSRSQCVLKCTFVILVMIISIVNNIICCLLQDMRIENEMFWKWIWATFSIPMKVVCNTFCLKIMMALQLWIMLLFPQVKRQYTWLHPNRNTDKLSRCPVLNIKHLFSMNQTKPAYSKLLRTNVKQRGFSLYNRKNIRKIYKKYEIKVKRSESFSVKKMFFFTCLASGDQTVDLGSNLRPH